MATYYFRNSNGNWNAASSWSISDGGPANGAVPTAADDAYFTSNSGSCTQGSTGMVCKTLIFSGVGAGNYTGTFTLNSTLAVSGNITLSSTMTFAGTSTITVNATSTLTSNGKTMTCSLTVSGASVVLTLGDNVTINGTFSIGAQTITGNTLYVGGGLIQTTAGIQSILTSNIEMIGTGNITTLTGGAAFSGAGNLTINTTGTITITSLRMYGNGRSFIYTAGTMLATGAIELLCTSGTFTLDLKGVPLSPPVAFTVSLATNGGTITLLSDFVVDGCRFQFGNSLLAASQACTITTSGGSLYLGKNLLPAAIGSVANSISATGDVPIIINGGGFCTFTVYQSIPLNLTFNFTGVLTLQNGILFGAEQVAMSLSAGTHTFINGRIRTLSNGGRLNGGLLAITGTCTLNGFDKASGIPFIRVATGITLTMDKFFSGRPDCITNVFCGTTTGSFTVTFSDTIEKFANWIRLSNCTLTRRGQLMLLNKSAASLITPPDFLNQTGVIGRNTGVRYQNSLPNGVPWRSPIVTNPPMAAGAGGLLSDPAIAL